MDRGVCCVRTWCGGAGVDGPWGVLSAHLVLWSRL